MFSIRLRLVLRLLDEDEELAIESDEVRGPHRGLVLERGERGQLIPENVHSQVLPIMNGNC